MLASGDKQRRPAVSSSAASIKLAGECCAAACRRRRFDQRQVARRRGASGLQRQLQGVVVFTRRSNSLRCRFVGRFTFKPKPKRSCRFQDSCSSEWPAGGLVACPGGQPGCRHRAPETWPPAPRRECLAIDTRANSASRTSSTKHSAIKDVAGSVESRPRGRFPSGSGRAPPPPREPSRRIRDVRAGAPLSSSGSRRFYALRQSPESWPDSPGVDSQIHQYAQVVV